MGILLKLKPVVNKKNGQINTSLQKKKLPKEILDEIKKQGSAGRQMLMEFKGWK